MFSEETVTVVGCCEDDGRDRDQDPRDQVRRALLARLLLAPGLTPAGGGHQRPPNRRTRAS